MKTQTKGHRTRCSKTNIKCFLSLNRDGLVRSKAEDHPKYFSVQMDLVFESAELGNKQTANKGPKFFAR